MAITLSRNGAEASSVSVQLDGCGNEHCMTMAWPLHRQLSNGYTRDASLMALDVPFETYIAQHRTARKRAARAARLGYVHGEIDRRGFEDDVYAINTSKPERQGRPMSDGYHERPVYGDNPVVCERHHVYTYGVAHDGKLVAYTWLYRSGELAMISTILGHADHLENDVMYLLVVGAIKQQIPMGGFLFYNLHSSGTDGLRYFKERIGLEPRGIAWHL